MISGVNTALNGLNRATQNFNQNTAKVAQGDLESETVVEGKIAQRDVETQLVNIKAQNEISETALDILA